MSTKFTSYAVRAAAVAKDALDEIKAAGDALEAAEQRKRETRIPAGSSVADAERLAQAARAEADLQMARVAYDKARRELPYSTKAQLSTIRRELCDALSGAFDARPSDVDGPTLELLKSGVLRPSEYVNLVRDARNDTMRRLAGKYAGDAAEALARQYGPDDERVLSLRAVALDGGATGESAVSDKLAAFDAIATAFETAASNGAMSDTWDGLVGPIVENF